MSAAYKTMIPLAAIAETCDNWLQRVVPFLVYLYSIPPQVGIVGKANLPPPKVAAPGRGPACPPLAPALPELIVGKSGWHYRVAVSKPSGAERLTE
ncbi:hypothetical protein TNCV_4753821 [Trichonephila clavipes]|nr:hypothetical protein TNCV_4753821 [Trichonephila clavipes]